MSDAPERIFLGVAPTDESYGLAYNRSMQWGVKSTTEYIRIDAITPVIAAEVLRKYWLEGKFETIGDVAMQELIDDGVTCQYTLVDNWLRNIVDCAETEHVPD